MPVEPCGNKCGRAISISILEGGNPSAKANPNMFSTEYTVCPKCQMYLCDKCSEGTCPQCKGTTIKGDPRREAQMRFQAQIDSCANAIEGLNLEKLTSHSEPVLQIIFEKTAIPIICQLEEQLASIGNKQDPIKCMEIAHNQLWRSYGAQRILNLHSVNEPMNLDISMIGTWLDLESHRMKMQSPDNPTSYPGMVTMTFKLFPWFDMAVGYCSKETIKALGLSDANLTDELVNCLMAITRSGIKIGCSEALAREEHLLSQNKLEPTGRALWINMIEHAWNMDDKAAEYFDPQRMFAIMLTLIQGDDQDIRWRAEASAVKLASRFDLNSDKKKLTTLQEAKTYWAGERLNEAFSLFEEEANRGTPEAQYILSSMYKGGTGCEQDEEQARMWVRRSADSNYAAGLGDCLVEGIGVEQNMTEGKRLLEHSANAGDSFAQMSLASRYDYSKPADREEGMTWLKKAAENGHFIARRLLSNLTNQDHNNR